MSDSEIMRLLAEHYELRADELIQIHSGPASRAWRVNSRGDRRSFCLKHHRQIGRDRLQAQQELMQDMRDVGFILAPQVVHGTAGDTIFQLPDGEYSLYRFVESDPPFNWTVGGWTKDQARSAGAALAEFHQFASKSNAPLPQGISAWDLRDWGLAVLQRASGLFPNDVIVRLGNFEDVLRSAFVVSAEPATQGVIHGDYHPGNVLFSGSNVVAVLDYEYCRRDSRLFDVAYATMTFSFEHMDPACGLALLDGYNKQSSAPPVHISALQPLVRLSGWLSGMWLIEQCQKGAAAHDEVLPSIRKCIAILSATLD